MHKSFLPLFLFALIGVLCTSFTPHDQITYQFFGLAVGLTPLVVYHFLLSRNDSLSPNLIDSIYYFGFLVTVITLVSTAISIAIDSKIPKMEWILLQFGLGLVATGYSLFARLLLLTKSTSQEDKNIVDASRELVLSISKNAEQFNDASYQAIEFVGTLKQRLEMLLDNTLEIHTKNIEYKAQKLLDSCALSIDNASNQFSEGISKIINELNRIETETKDISFEIAGKRMQSFSNEIEKSVSNISEKIMEASGNAANSVSELASISRKVQKLATDIAAKLERLDQIQYLLDAILNTTEALGSFNASATHSASTLNKLASISTETSRVLTSEILSPLNESGVGTGLLKLTKSFPENAENLATSISDLNFQSSELSNLLALNRIKLASALTANSSDNYSLEHFKILDQTANSVCTALIELHKTISSLNQNLLSVAAGIEIPLNHQLKTKFPILYETK